MEYLLFSSFSVLNFKSINVHGSIKIAIKFFLITLQSNHFSSIFPEEFTLPFEFSLIFNM
jgi:hypothetical protein